jgi:hypothetical protein
LHIHGNAPDAERREAEKDDSKEKNIFVGKGCTFKHSSWETWEDRLWSSTN